MLWFLCVRFIALNNTNNTRNIYLYICKMNSTVIVDSWKKTPTWNHCNIFYFKSRCCISMFTTQSLTRNLSTPSSILQCFKLI